MSPLNNQEKKILSDSPVGTNSQSQILVPKIRGIFGRIFGKKVTLSLQKNQEPPLSEETSILAEAIKQRFSQTEEVPAQETSSEKPYILAEVIHDNLSQERVPAPTAARNIPTLSVVKELQPKPQIKVVVNNTLVSDTTRTPELITKKFLQSATENTLLKMINAQSVEELIHCITRDFILAIREIEAQERTEKNQDFTLIREQGIQLTVVLHEKIRAYNHFIIPELKKHCEVLTTDGGRLFKPQAECYSTSDVYNNIQVGFDFYPGKDVYGNLLSLKNEKPYYAHLQSSLDSMVSVFVDTLSRLNEKIREDYVDAPTGLLNHQSFIDIRNHLKATGKPFTEYFFEVNSQNFPDTTRGYLGDQVIINLIADKIREKKRIIDQIRERESLSNETRETKIILPNPIDLNRAFVFRENNGGGKIIIVIYIDITNSQSIENTIRKIKSEIDIPLPNNTTIEHVSLSMNKYLG